MNEKFTLISQRYGDGEPGQAQLFFSTAVFWDLPTNVLLYRPLRRKKISSSSRLPYVRISQYLSPSEVVRHTAPEKHPFQLPSSHKNSPRVPALFSRWDIFFLAHPPFLPTRHYPQVLAKATVERQKESSTLPSSKKKAWILLTRYRSTHRCSQRQEVADTNREL